MATKTDNYNLIKPAANDYAEIGVLNQNMDLIDQLLKMLEDAKASLGQDGKVLAAQLPEMDYAPGTHAAQHAAGGADPITPAAIGAAVAGHTHTAADVGALPSGGTAASATKLAAKRTIDGVSFDGSVNITHYGSCSTAAATAAKVAACTGFTLGTGARIAVKFTVTNTAANPTLNVNGTGAKAIYYRGAAISAGYLAANRTYEFVYNGAQYELVGDLDTNTTYTPASAAPKMNGTAAVGTSAKYAREDHVHPVDTSRAAASHNHSAANITSGTLAADRLPTVPVTKGGTGQTTLAGLVTALAGQGVAKIQTGSYVGTGTYGAANPCSLTFNFVPIFGAVFLTRYAGKRALFFGKKGHTPSDEYPASSNFVDFTVAGNTVSWHTDRSSESYDQLNEEGEEYTYVFFG